MGGEQRVSVEQKDTMVDFMLDNINFTCNKLVGIEGRKNCSNLWTVLANTLN